MKRGAGRILLVAGYGGHAGFAYTVGYYLRMRDIELDILVPRGYNWVREKMSGLGRVIEVTLPRKPAEPLVYGVHRWLRSTLESLSLCREKYPVVFASGSNFSIPPSVMCRLRGSTILTLEDVARFSRRSAAVNILHRIGALVFLHWSEQLRLYSDGVVAGPVYEPPIYKPSDEGYILVTTGTFGHRKLFDAIDKLGLNRVVMQTGDVDPAPYINRHPEWIVFTYTSDIHRWIAGASLVITHYPGTTALTARLAYGKPVVMVYSPRHYMAAPREDADILASRLNAVYLENVTPESLMRAIEEAYSLKPPLYRNGGELIARYIIEAVEDDT